MLKAVGFSDSDLKKPLIGVANTWIEIGPCNFHLRELAKHVKDGIRAAGGAPAGCGISGWRRSNRSRAPEREPGVGSPRPTRWPWRSSFWASRLLEAAACPPMIRRRPTWRERRARG